MYRDWSLRARNFYGSLTHPTFGRITEPVECFYRRSILHYSLQPTCTLVHRSRRRTQYLKNNILCRGIGDSSRYDEIYNAAM